MPSTSKVASGEFGSWRSRLVMAACALLIVAMASAGIPSDSAAKAAPAVHVVKIENMKFSPAVLAVQIGDRVEFKNEDLVPHTATARPSGAFDSGLVKPGESWTFVALAGGKLTYTCAFHPTMAGEINVKAR